jgi:lipid-binding SYLF domain-containing protein
VLVSEWRNCLADGGVFVLYSDFTVELRAETFAVTASRNVRELTFDSGFHQRGSLQLMNSRRHIRSIFFALICANTAFVSPTQASPSDRQDARLSRATQVVGELQAAPDQNVPAWLLERAYAVAIIPEVIKVGLGIGARRGSGVLVIRKDDGHWSNPVFINLTGGSFGFQAGVQSTDVMLVFTSRSSIEGIAGGKVTLGADASVAAGPVGRQTEAATDVGLAQVLSYSRSVGLFAGIALDGSALTIDHKSNAIYYDRPGVLASEIVASNAPVPPENAQKFVLALDNKLGVAKPQPAPTTSDSVQTSTRTETNAKPAEAGKLTTHPMEDPSPGQEPPP